MYLKVARASVSEYGKGVRARRARKLGERTLYTLILQGAEWKVWWKRRELQMIDIVVVLIIRAS